MVLGIKRSLFLCILLSLFLTCKSASVESNTKVETYLTSYLKNRYNTDFELISLNKANAPGETFDNYEAKLLSTEYSRREFYITISGEDDLKVNVDQFPIILLEEAFLRTVDISLYKDFPVVLEVEGKIVEGEFLDGINNIEDAIAKLGELKETSWTFSIYTIVDDPKEKIYDLEDMVINLLRQSYKTLPCKSTSNVYVYEDESLTEEDITPDMNVGVIRRTPHRKKVSQKWILGWTPKKLESFPNDFQYVVKKRKTISY